MFKQTKFLRIFALSMAILPAAEIGAIFILARHDIATISTAAPRQNAIVKSSVTPNIPRARIGLKNMPTQEMILINGTPVWTTLSGS